MSSETTQQELRCEVEYKDWIDISESEFVDYVEGRTSVAFVFEHEEIGLHGVKFDPATGVLRAVAFSESGDDG